MTNDAVLVKLEGAYRLLAEAKTIQDTKKIIDMATAAEVYAKRQKLSEESINYATNIKVEALRQLGMMLKATERNKGERGQFTGGNQKELPAAPPTLSELGIDKKVSSLAQKIADLSEDEIKQVKEGVAIAKVINQTSKEKRIREEQEQRVNTVSSIEIRKGDFKEALADVYGIDAIITDPPYPAEYLQCFSDLSEFASKHLKDDGFLVAYSGQYHLPEVIRRLSEHLTYVWTFCLYHAGKKQLVNGVNIMCGWKPILIFSRGRKKMRYSAYDVAISEQMEKHSHEWQQSESGVKHLVEVFSKPGELVVDPFCGSGTFLKVANDLGRKTIGAEIK